MHSVTRLLMNRCPVSMALRLLVDVTNAYAMQLYVSVAAAVMNATGKECGYSGL